MREHASVLATDRLLLRRFHADDAPFILALVNDPSWLRYIGDKHVRTLQDARRYIQTGPVAMYRRLGFGLYLVARKDDGRPVGMCGLIRREELEDVDLGFALLREFRGHGYAAESASAVVAYGRNVLGLARIVAVCSQDNDPSAKLLVKLGFRREDTIRLQPDGEALDLYGNVP